MKRVLIVDDKEENRYLLRAFLQGHGHAVIEARNGAEALREARQSPPDLVISDILMPVMDGYTLCREWKADAQLRGIPFVVYTATYTDAKDEELAQSLGADAYIRKPAEPKPFVAQIDTVLRAAEAGQLAAPKTVRHEPEQLKQYSEALVRKLEDKMRQQEQANRALQADIAARQQAEQALRDSETRFRQLAENIYEVFWITDVSKQQVLYISPGYELIWGRSCSSLYAEPRSWLDAIHPEDRTRVLDAAMTRQLNGSYDEEYRILQPDGSLRWIRDRAFPVRDATGAVSRIVGIADDITPRVAQEQKLKRLSRLHAVLSGITGMIVRERSRDALFREACRIAVEVGGFRLAWLGEVRPDGGIEPIAVHGHDAGYLDLIRPALRASDADSAGPTAQMLRKRTTVVCNDIAHDPAMAHRREAALQRGFHAMVAQPLLVVGAVLGCLNLYAAEGGAFDAEELGLLQELAGNLAYALEFISNKERAEYLTNFDPLTGLANRRLFLDRLNAHLDTARRRRRLVAVSLVDLDNFRSIVSALGPVAGEELLRTAAIRLTGVAGGAKFLARIVADRFALVAPNLRAAADLAPLLSDSLDEQLSRPVTLQSKELRVTAKTGVAIFPSDGEDGETLLGNAEAALKNAKLSGERVVFYTSQLGRAVKERLDLESQLRRALALGEFVLHYQPKVDLRSGAICGAEALLRWNSPTAGLVLPARFVGLLEDSGMIVDVGRWALRQAVADRRHWQASGLQPPRVAVNVSPRQMKQADFVDVVRAEVVIPDEGEPGLDLEVTESLLMGDSAAAIARLRALRDLGLAIVIDDFGTGYSSLAYLARLPLTAIKIDRSFIMRMVEHPDDMSIVSAIITLAHSMSLKVIAEGVDSAEQLKFLRLLRCDELQGFLYSDSLSAEAFAQLLARPHRLT